MKNLVYSRSTSEFIYNFIVFLIFLSITTLLLRFLWNGTLVKHITILKPVETLTQTFLLALGISLFRL